MIFMEFQKTEAASKKKESESDFVSATSNKLQDL